MLHACLPLIVTTAGERRVCPMWKGLASRNIISDLLPRRSSRAEVSPNRVIEYDVNGFDLAMESEESVHTAAIGLGRAHRSGYCDAYYASSILFLLERRDEKPGPI